MVVARLDSFAFLTDMELTSTGELVLVGGSNVPGIVLTANALKSELTVFDDSNPDFNDWQMTKIDESASTVTAPRIGENRFDDFRDVVSVVNANGNATFHPTSPVDLYLASVETVDNFHHTGTYLGGGGRDRCDRPVTNTTSGDIIFLQAPRPGLGTCASQ